VAANLGGAGPPRFLGFLAFVVAGLRRGVGFGATLGWEADPHRGRGMVGVDGSQGTGFDFRQLYGRK
jgi:hypothetical protein